MDWYQYINGNDNKDHNIIDNLYYSMFFRILFNSIFMKKNLSGTTIGSYNVKEIIGEGSLGEVYRALDQNGDLVAIKVIL